MSFVWVHHKFVAVHPVFKQVILLGQYLCQDGRILISITEGSIINIAYQGSTLTILCYSLPLCCSNLPLNILMATTVEIMAIYWVIMDNIQIVTGKAKLK